MATYFNIRRAIKAHHLKSREVAERLGVTPESIISYGKGNPTVRTLFKIADAIGCDVRELFYSDTDIPVQEVSVTPPTEHTYTCPHCGTAFQILE